MKNKYIYKVRCSDCDALVCHKGQPQRIRGVTMQPGLRYCTVFKRPRCFKSRDPKFYVPKWCPKLLHPPILRIYGFRDYGSRFVYEMFGSILAFRYCVRYTSTTYQTANEILANGTLKNLEVDDGEVVELDDGIRPVFFCMKNGKLQVTMFQKKMVTEETSHQPD